MKKLASSLIIILFIQMFSNLCFGQSKAGGKISWTQTSVKDFSENQLNNLSITNRSGGEVQLSHPLKKITDDYNVSAYTMFATRNSQGDYLKTWMLGRDVYVQKFSKANLPVTDPIRVNDTAGICGDNTHIRSAFMDNNTYIILFVPDGYHPTKPDNNMYGQVFIQDSIRSGRNFRINEKPNYSNRVPTAFFNPADKTFWILFDGGNTTDGYKMYVQKRKVSGEISGQTFLLNAVSNTMYESGPMAVVCGDKLAVTWWGANGIVSNEVDIYARWFTLQGEPITKTARINSDTTRQGARFSPWIGNDEKGNTIIAWGQIVWPSNEGKVYAQLFDADGNKIRDNFLINGINLNSYYSPCIEYVDGIFNISYRISSSTANDAYITKWKLENILSGEMTSSILDLGYKGATFDEIHWDGDLSSGAALKFKMRGAQDTVQLKNSQWYGPLLSDTSYYSLSEGQPINPIHNTHRFIQYKAFFNTPVIHNTPVLNSISINYLPNDTSAPAAPKNFTAQAGHSSVMLNWAPNTESDLAGYVIYKGTESNIYDPEWTVKLPSSASSYSDTLTVTGRTYYYTIAAVDSAGNKSDMAQEVNASPFGINYYVSNKGSDRNDGSQNDPMLTISSAINAARYGDNVMVLPGDYKDNLRMKRGVSVIGSGAQFTKLEQKDPSYSNAYGANEAMLQGFTIETRGPGSSPAVNTSNSDVKICDNRILFTGEAMPYIPPAVQCTDSLMPQILRNYMEGFSVGVNITPMCRAIVKNNIIRANDEGVNFTSFYYGEIVNNTIIVKRFAGINFAGTGTIVKNNIIYGLDTTSSAGISAIGWAEQYDVSYNNVWNCYRNFLNLTQGLGNLVKDPLFFNVNVQNYHLKAGSSCINAGDPSVEYKDKDGSRNDMGAYGGPDPIRDDVSVMLFKSLSVSKLSAFAGDTVSVKVNIDNPAGILKGSFSLKFDSRIMNYLNTVKTTATESFNVQAALSADGCLNVSFHGDRPINITDSEFLKFRFTISQKSSGLTSSISVISLSCLDEDLNPIYFKSISDGMVSIGNLSASKNIIYVGNSTGTKEDGSFSYPFSSIQKGIDLAKYGDTVSVAGGEYNESIKMKDGVYVIGSGAVITTITPEANKRAVDFTNVSIGKLSGFTIKNNGLDGFDPFIGLINIYNSSPVLVRNVIDCREKLAGGILIGSNSKPRIENNSFLCAGINTMGNAAPVIKNNHISLMGAIESGIRCSDSSAAVFTGNKIRIEVSSIFVSYCSPVFKNNRITVTGGPECFLINRAKNVLITNNIIEDFGDGAKAIRIDDASDISIINNTIKAKTGGIQEIGSTVKIMNNIVTGAKDAGVSISSPSMLQYNDIWGNGMNYPNISPGTTDIQADPKFADSDYHLAQGSPCINAGSPDGMFNDKNGSRNDIGAYGGPEADLDWVNMKNNCRLQIDSVHASLNDTVRLNVNAYSVKNTSDIEFTVSFDPEYLSFMGAVPSALTRGFSMQKSSFSSSSVQIALTGSNAIGENDGPIAEILFLVKKGGNSGSQIRFESASLTDNIKNPVLVSDMVNGKIIVNPSGIEEDKGKPSSYFLANNYPNPFNPLTTIEYGIQKASGVRLKIYDVLGREIMTLVDKEQNAGKYRIPFNAISLPSGVYIYSLEAGEFRASKKLMLVK